MIYCDKCKDQLPRYHISDKVPATARETFTLDLCQQCYNEFIPIVNAFMKNHLWSETNQGMRNSVGMSTWDTKDE